MSDSTLGRYCSLNKAGIDPRFYPDEPFYYYSLPDFDTGGKVALSLGKSIDSNKFLVQQESLLISKLNPRIKRVWLVRNDCRFRSISSTEFVNLIPNDNAAVDYLFYFFQQDSLFRQLESEAVGTTNSHVRFKPDLLCRIPGELPPLPQQRKIARILTTIDNLIEKTEALIAKYQAIKQGMMHDLFTRGVDEHGHLRPPYEEAPELYKQSELGWIPKEWETMRLNDAIRIIDCKHYTPMFRPEGIAFIRPRNVKVVGLDFSDVEYVSAEDYRLLTDKHEPHKGDIVFSRNASFGVPCYIDHERPFAIGQDTVVMTETKADSKYIFYALLSAPTEMQVRRASTGSTFGRINLAFIRDLRIPLPPRGEQSQIAKLLDNLEARLKVEASSAEKLSTTKTGLMQDLLTGKVRVKVDEAEEIGHV